MRPDQVFCRGEYNLGHLCRKEFGDLAYTIGFGILQMSHVMIDPCGVRPVALDRHESEALLRDQLARDALAHPVKFRRTVGGFTEQHDPCVADAREQWVQL